MKIPFILKITLLSILGIVVGFGLEYSLLFFDYYLNLTILRFILKVTLFSTIVLHFLNSFKLNFLKINLDSIKLFETIVLFSSFILTLGLNASIRTTNDYTWHTFGGILPFSDSLEYYKSLLNWPSTHLSVVNSWRPFNHLINSFSYFLGGKTFLGFLLIRIAFLSISIGFFFSKVSKYLGVFLGFAAAIILLDWTIPFTNTFLSEPNGIFISLIGYGFLLDYDFNQNKKYLFLSIFFLTIANISRPFNFVSPLFFCLIILFNNAMSFRIRIRYFILLSVSSLLLMSFLPKVIFNWIGHPDAVPNGNASYTVLGVTRNTDWIEANNYIKSKNPEVKKNKIISKLANLEAIDNFKANPMNTFNFFVRSIKYAFKSFTIRNFSLFKQLNLQRIRIIVFFLGLTIVMLFLIGINKQISFNLRFVLLAGIASFFSFAPIVFLDGHWRITATLLGPISLFIPASIYLITKFILKENMKIPSNESSIIKENTQVGYFFIAFFVLSSFYVLITWKLNTPNNLSNGVTIVINNHPKKTQWIDFNTFATNFNLVDKWYYHLETECGNQGFAPLKKYFLNNSGKIMSVKIDSLKYILVPIENQQLPELPSKDSINNIAPKFNLLTK